MTHTPPVPPASTSPYPLHPAPSMNPDADGATGGTSRDGGKSETKPDSTGRQIAIGAAVGIGSAAIVAALLFAGNNRGRG